MDDKIKELENNINNVLNIEIKQINDYNICFTSGIINMAIAKARATNDIIKDINFDKSKKEIINLINNVDNDDYIINASFINPAKNVTVLEFSFYKINGNIFDINNDATKLLLFIHDIISFTLCILSEYYIKIIE